MIRSRHHGSRRGWRACCDSAGGASSLLANRGNCAGPTTQARRRIQRCGLVRRGLLGLGRCVDTLGLPVGQSRPWRRCTLERRSTGALVVLRDRRESIVWEASGRVGHLALMMRHCEGRCCPKLQPCDQPCFSIRTSAKRRSSSLSDDLARVSSTSSVVWGRDEPIPAGELEKRSSTSRSS